MERVDFFKGVLKLLHRVDLEPENIAAALPTNRQDYFVHQTLHCASAHIQVSVLHICLVFFFWVVVHRWTSGFCNFCIVMDQ